MADAGSSNLPRRPVLKAGKKNNKVRGIIFSAKYLVFYTFRAFSAIFSLRVEVPFKLNCYEIYKQPLICILDKQEVEKIENTSPIVFLTFKVYCHKFTDGPLICIIDKQEAQLCIRKSYIIGQLLLNMITKTNNG